MTMPMTDTARNALAIMAAVISLSACGEVIQTKQGADKQGCEWIVSFRVHFMGGDVVGLEDVKPKFDRDGKQFCGVKP